MSHLILSEVRFWDWLEIMVGAKHLYPCEEMRKVLMS